MAQSGRKASVLLAGRVRELGRLHRAITGAEDWQPSAVFVHGEAGVGKTRLVNTACDLARDRGFAVLSGRCVRFGAVESVLLPWVVALEGWVASADPGERRRVLEAVPCAAQLLPSLGGGRAEDAAWLLTVAESLVAHVVALRPTVLVMDDVQWADAASRDALTYLVAGFGRQRQVVLATYRDEGLPPGDPLFGWVADLRRLPSVSELRLDRLTHEETGEQLASLLGGVPGAGLVADVVRRSGGNPYLTELLVQGLDPQTEELPGDLPADLATALLAAWHRLSGMTRGVVSALAVAGRPASVERLSSTCAALGLHGGDLRGALAEATASGIVVRTDDGALWLRHPLLADVLYGTYLPGEAAPVHRAWAAGLETVTASGADEVRRLGDLALHHERAGDLDASFQASVRAADGARTARLWREEPIHLRRAARLWPAVGEDSRAGLGEADLLERAAVASVRVGQEHEGVAAGRRALELVRAAGDELRTSRLMIWCEDASWWLGEVEGESVELARAAVALSSRFPDSREHAHALGSLSEALSWRGDWKAAAQVADDAVAAARRAGSAEALSAALAARSFAHQSDESCEGDSLEALRQARLCGDPDLIQWASQARCNVLLSRGGLREATAVGEAALASAMESGALAAVTWHAGQVAGCLADEGRLRDAAHVVRIGLSLTGIGNGAAAVRLSAAVLAVRCGDLVAAELHLNRAQEQIPTLEVRPGLVAPPNLAECLLAQRSPQAAVDLLRRTMPAHSVDPRVTDLMMLWGVRAAADLADASRDRRNPRGLRAARVAMDDLAAVRDQLPGSPFTGRDPGDPVLAAWRAIRDAEVSRCDGAVAPDLWRLAAERCAKAGLGWEEQVANLRWGVALLASDVSRAEATVPLRTAHRFADAEGATGLRRDLEAIAAAAQLSLAEPVVVPPQSHHASPFPALTKREEEVLTHLVAGRTYAEIAAALFVTEKTVSTHVSNLLRKTGTSSRHEVSALAVRLQRSDALS